MKINIPENCIIINGTIYALVDEGPDCTGCVFKDENKASCEYGTPCITIFSAYNGIFKRVSPLI
jgi:hypothetical protein